MSEMDDLAAFAVLMEAGSFTAAAERLGCSKGQLSKRIRLLEQGLGASLLHRTTRRLDLTAAGAALLPEAQALAAQAERARQSVRRLQEELAGCVRLTVPVSLGETFFDALLLDFTRQYPQIRVELDLHNGYRDLVAEGFDLAIRSGVDMDERLVARPLFSLEEITCATPAYLASHGEPRQPADLARHQCLLNTHYSGFEEWLYHQQHRLERVKVAGALASNHYSLLKKAALSGAGVARLPSYMIYDELADGRLVWLLRDFQTRQTPVFLVHPWQGGLPRRTQVLVDYLLAWFERSRRKLDKAGE
ncbi:LysR family transcriptional regulator [Pseudomonas sp. JS3066]|jgi:DNA-binding transcriptional LysR family regulator|uniref:LysR family transcriptional regulator n=1 Tax=unclassified Pseudomonas TaxID=196821 RepID=UPI000EA946A7|nr:MULTISPECIES: LysR family transcriptional regulator [unclassified Pseudomonas]AYF85769.1 LysR family transcriptional regulator [Pseudomonas sp. DY-1]MDH4654958.1 LysR family transcriptional regulator [Pseudomonas sp. BN606]MRK19449.1 LysR family transcriptional regulator [Pseudomonas sp. JG-B]WVK91647.1 LysR family transcriptional regulator [Pseudomonas sp. JS3066]